MRAMNGEQAAKIIARLKARGWTEPEIAAKLALRSTDTFRKWAKGHDPLVGTAKALAALDGGKR